MPDYVSSTLGSSDYLEAGLLRLEEAQHLYDRGLWVGAIYLAGRAAESLLRSILWKQGRQQEIGHDLVKILKRIRVFITLSGTEDRELDDAVNEVAVIWRNDLRFTGDERFRRLLRANGRMCKIGSMNVKGDPLKANAKSILEASEKIIARGEPLCH